MMTTTVNISFPSNLLRAMDRVAKRESRSRSELLREAARVYLERRQRWDQLFAIGRQYAKRFHLKPQDIEKRIAEYRRERASRS